MTKERQLARGVAMISALAGPIFLVLLILFDRQSEASQPVMFETNILAAIVAFTALAAFFGAIVAFPVCMAAASLLAWLGDRIFLFRPLVTWVFVAAALALGVCHFLFGTVSDTGVYAFCCTAMVCAAFIHRRMGWA